MPPTGGRSGRASPADRRAAAPAWPARASSRALRAWSRSTAGWRSRFSRWVVFVGALNRVEHFALALQRFVEFERESGHAAQARGLAQERLEVPRGAAQSREREATAVGGHHRDAHEGAGEVG